MSNKLITPLKFENIKNQASELYEDERYIDVIKLMLEGLVICDKYES